MIRIILLLSLVTTASSFASLDYLNEIQTGGDMSGGGYILICNEGEPNETIELLDYYEAKHTIRDFQLSNLSLISGDDEFEKAISFVKSKLKVFSPELTRDFVGAIQDFKNFDINFIERGIIVDINDADIPIGPLGNCKKKQVAVQSKNPAPMQYRVLVDKAYWEKMDMNTKIGLILHEAYYRTGLKQGHTNSNKVRVLNSLIASASKNNLELRSIFNYAEINGCMNLKMGVEGSLLNDGTVIEGLSFILPVWIDSYGSDCGVSYAKLCRHWSKDNILNGERLTLTQNSEVITRGDSMEFTSTANQTSGVPYFDKDGIRYKNNLKFRKRDISTPQILDLVRAQKSSAEFWTMAENYLIEECEDFIFDQGMMRECTVTKGEFVFFGNSYEIESFGRYPGEFKFKFSERFKVNSVTDQALNFENEVIRKNAKGIYIFKYVGGFKDIAVDGREIKIRNEDKFKFNRHEILVDILRDGISILK